MSWIFILCSFSGHCQFTFILLWVRFSLESRNGWDQVGAPCSRVLCLLSQHTHQQLPGLASHQPLCLNFALFPLLVPFHISIYWVCMARFWKTEDYRRLLEKLPEAESQCQLSPRQTCHWPMLSPTVMVKESLG